MTYEEKIRFCETDGLTLDGKPAVIGGARNPFANVIALNPGGYTVEFAWETVKRIVENNYGRFYS